MQSDGRIPDEKTSATPSITAAPPPTPDGHLGQIGMTMHHRIAIASSMEARRASMDVSRRISIDARQGRQSSMLPAYSGILEEVATASEIYTHSQVQSSSRPSTPLLQSGPERSSNSLPDMQRSGELQRPRSDGLASKGSPFAHPSQQQCSKTQQKASGVVKAAGLLAVLLVCCLGVWSVNQTAGSFMPLVRRQLNANKRAARGEALAGIVTQCPPNTYAGPSGCKACGIGLVTTGPGATSQDACGELVIQSSAQWAAAFHLAEMVVAICFPNVANNEVRSWPVNTLVCSAAAPNRQFCHSRDWTTSSSSSSDSVLLNLMQLAFNH